MTPFIGPSYTLNSRTADAQRAVNMHLAPIESGSGANTWMLKSIPGLNVFASAYGEGRGCFESGGRAFVVIGAKFYELSATGSLTELGTLNTSSGPVDMDANMVQIGIVDGPNGYVLNKATNVFQWISDPDFPGSQRIAYLKQLFIYANPDSSTGAVYISALGDGADVDALDFQSAESRPDPLVSFVVVGELLWLLGSKSSEVWAFTTGGTFPLEKIDGASSQTGCIAPFSLMSLNNTAIWLGNDLTVWQSNGYQPIRVSNKAVEKEIAKSTDKAGARAYGYTHEGHVFYCLNLPGVDTTWCLDLLTGQWHERAELVNGLYQKHRATSYMYAHGKHLVLADNGVIYEMDADTYTNAGDTLCRSRVAPHMVTPDGQFHTMPEVVLQMDKGSGGSCMARLSKDGGASFGDWRVRSLGALGRYMQQVKFSALGGGKDLVLEVRCTDNVPFDIVNASFGS